MIATRLGPYRITAKLGAGGMGEVYRATDTRLKREVAIKVLPAGFTADPERLARFEREAQMLAQLQHPHIAAIFGLEEADGERALVMELVEGEDLAALIARGALPLADALPIARQIAEALEAAHEQGIVHRDLKPANVMVRPDGTVKVLDFGLAKAMDPPSGTLANVANVENSPTLTARATELGVILGTAAYMAPEQARGKSVDKRADIWAFGAVVYEMLCGRRAFGGEETSDVLAAVLRQEIDWRALPADTPPRLRRLLARCLERDVKERLRDVGEARVEIGKVLAGAPDTGVLALAATPAPRRWLGRLAWLAAGMIATAAFAVVVGLAAKPDSDWDARVVRVAFMPPAGVVVDEGVYDATVVSPDGRQLVFAGRVPGGRRMLWLRALDALDARALPGTEDAIEPFWSPDSRSLGFGAEGKLKRLDFAGGLPQTLADAPRLTGGTWSEQGVIVFGPDYGSGLLRVPAAGGAAAAVNKAPRAPGEAHSQPRFLPGGRRYLFRVVAGGPPKVMVGTLDSDEVKPLLADVGSAGARYAPPGWLLYVRNEQLVAQPFDAGSAKLGGEPVSVSLGLAGALDFSAGRFSVSDNGVLVLQNPRALQYQLSWYDRSGVLLDTVGEQTTVTQGESPEISPDGRLVAIQRADPKTRNMDLWLVDLARGAFNRLTTDPQFDQLPVWMPDGRSLLFTRQGLRRTELAGGTEELLLAGPMYAKSVSPDGRFVIFVRRGETTRDDIWVLPLVGERTPYALLQTEFDDDQPQLSRDGRWLAYSSDVTGRREVYVRPVVAAAQAGRIALGEATLVSTQGGVLPRWRRDGRELYYLEAPQGTAHGLLVAVAAEPHGTVFGVGAVTPLFDTRMVPNATSCEYDVAADGRKFLVGAVVREADTPPVSLVLNWTADLPR